MQRRSKLSRRHASIDALEPRLLFAVSPVIIGYLPDYELSHLSLSSIDLGALTQVNYFSITPTSTGSLPSSSTDGFSFAGPTSQLIPLVAAAHSEPQRVSVFITLDPATPFQTIAASSTATTNLVNNLLTFCSTYNLDGIDLDYEPGNDTLSSTQMDQWGSFLDTLHDATSSHGLLLSEAVQVTPPYIIPTAYLSYVDRYIVMDYTLDYNSSAPYAASLTYLHGMGQLRRPQGRPLHGNPVLTAAPAPVGATPPPKQYSSDSQLLCPGQQRRSPSPSTDTVTINGVTWGFNGVTTVQKKMPVRPRQRLRRSHDLGTRPGLLLRQRLRRPALLPAIDSILGAATETWTGSVSTAWNNPGKLEFQRSPNRLHQYRHQQR